MTDLQYNFLGDTFTTYENVKTPKVKLQMPLGDIDLEDKGLYIGNNGVVLANDNIPEKRQAQLIINNNEEVPITEQQNSNFIQKSNLQGNKKQAMEFFQSKGLSAHAAAGIVGNLIQESNLNTRAIGDKGKAIGIAQWHPDRQKGLKELAKQKGTDIYDLNTQLEYIWQELNSSHKSALNGLLSSRNLDEATIAFMNKFEKPNAQYANLKARIGYGSQLLV